MKEVYLKVKHEPEIVLYLFSDPDFALPKIMPGYESHTIEGGAFRVIGVIGIYPYVLQGGAFKGSVVKYVFKIEDGLDGTGSIEILKEADGLKFILDYEGSGKSQFESAFEKTIKKLSKSIDEEIRIERIKRKI